MLLRRGVGAENNAGAGHIPRIGGVGTRSGMDPGLSETLDEMNELCCELEPKSSLPCGYDMKKADPYRFDFDLEGNLIKRYCKCNHCGQRLFWRVFECP